ncbi:MAG TPA: ferrous iron transport protein B [Sandaracinaceae bacterium LLY-WYZ-13_1]|nr:ferrous iron transport protein B [Sandaracinaceae bacterium LLY-WYZ-13_1]
MTAAPRLAPEVSPAPLRVALAGNPNAGKTTLFNALTGARARTGNYPGITVDRRTGPWRLGEGAEAELLDVPGTYSLSARSPEEQVAVEAVLPADGAPPDVVVVVADATALERHLYLALQIVETGRPTVLALNMMDEARAAGIAIDREALAEAMGAEVVPIVASRGEGLEALRAAVRRQAGAPAATRPPEPVDGAVADDVAEVEAVLAEQRPDDSPGERRARALWALLSLGDDELEGVPARLREVTDAVHARAEAAGRNLDREIIAGRYARIDAWVLAAVTADGHGRAGRPGTERLDAVLTHPVAGVLVFALVMYLLFEALFAWSDPLIGLIEAGVGWAQGLAAAVLPDGPLEGLLVDGVLAGVGNVVVFVPQIALLFVFIAVLEDSGYLARVAFVIDRVMRGVGLHGKAFVPLLSGFACAIPAVMATRTIESRKDRLVTMLALPLMSCSARLPVYALVIAVVFATDERLFGVLSIGAVVLFAMYALSVVATLGAAAVLRRTVLKGPRPPLVLELPPYRMPGARNVASAVGRRVKSFLVDAGTIILAITIVLWALLSFPRSEAITAEHAELREEARVELSGEALKARLARVDALESEAQLRHSAAGRLGHFIEPALAPLGFDWRIGVGLIGSFAAREVLVSTLGIVWGIGEEADEESVPLREALREAERPDGSKLFTPLSGLALMVFFVLAAQCMSTLAVVRRESGSWKWPLLMLGYMTVLAYVGAWITYQGGQLLGFT